MVKLTTKYLFRRISKKSQLQPRKKDETDLDYLQRVTHLRLQSQFIDKISAIPECRAVTVVYLQNNLLRVINNMECFPRITHLYLQHNFISKIENLDKLTSLKKLYLGNNEISVVEGVQNLVNLTELHIENQRLAQGETIYFDPLSLLGLQNSLKVLNVSNNSMTSMVCLSGLTSLWKLLIENNHITEVSDVTETLSQLPSLEILSLEGNPVVSDRKFLDSAIVSSKSLKDLNGKRIDERTRLFVTNLAHNKECRERLMSYSTRALTSNEDLSEVGRFSKPASIPSTRLRPKPFPVLKSMAEDRQKSFKSPSVSLNNGSSILKNSFDISSFAGSASAYL